MEIKIELKEQDDGRYLILYNGRPLGYLDDVKPLVEINKVHELISLSNKIKYSDKLLQALNEEILYRLVRLVAFYNM